MFQKLDNRYEGTGIGLAIVRKVVHRMGGKVGVESAPERGTLVLSSSESVLTRGKIVLDRVPKPPTPPRVKTLGWIPLSLRDGSRARRNESNAEQILRVCRERLPAVPQGQEPSAQDFNPGPEGHGP